ncbi:SDR family oxidoreductase [Nocardia sp. NPDC046473]|uniref:SDR family NAD(P)-dependent oxidoreductase n=1 Tax=Nocardia sp. NPDC046473 TaxID=3155733 RepID=UPI0033CC682E
MIGIHDEDVRGRRAWAVVAGSAGAVGREAALRLAEDGYSVVVCGRDGAGAEETRKLIEWAGGRAVEVVADLGDSAAVRRLITETVALLEGAPVEVLVNNAGEAGCGPVEDVFDTVFALNVKVPLLLTGAFAPGMAEHGRGAIVNVGSSGPVTGAAGRSVVQAATSALVMLTRLWTAEYGPRGVRVNSVDPGGALAAQLSGPVAVAEAIRFLASPRAASIQGAVLTMNEGELAAACCRWSSSPA